jgi:hypothetical protein
LIRKWPLKFLYPWQMKKLRKFQLEQPHIPNILPETHWCTVTETTRSKSSEIHR